MLIQMLTLIFLVAQETPVTTATRSEDLQQVREQKAQSLKPPSRNFLENALYELRERRLVERFQEGIWDFHPLIGGMHSGSGFAAGTVLRKDGFRASAQGSLRGYQEYEVGFGVDQDFFADVAAIRRVYPHEDFYGLGNDSTVEAATQYQFEDTSYGASFGFSPADDVRAGTRAGFTESSINTGDLNFRFVEIGGFLEIDRRDEPGNPRSGGLYTTSYSSFLDHTPANSDFDRFNAEVQQYFPFLNQRRVVALRARTTLTRSASEQPIPFFMQPSAGGSEDLRGFRDYRFRDRNMVVLNAEYRWEAFPGLDLALFADAGQVAAKVADIALNDFHKSYGLGFRLSTARSVFFRVDAGFSNEGRQVFVKFNHVF